MESRIEIDEQYNDDMRDTRTLRQKVCMQLVYKYMWMCKSRLAKDGYPGAAWSSVDIMDHAHSYGIHWTATFPDTWRLGHFNMHMNSMHVHENSEGLSSATNPKPKGITIP